MVSSREREDHVKKKNCPSIVPFLNVVDFYLRNEPVHGLTPAWREFRRAALESMGILCTMLGRGGAEPDPGCIDTPKWSRQANFSLDHKVPADKLKKEAKKLRKVG
jgi:hypothetical protein